MKVVIVGGGFGGLKTAIELARRGVEKITLVSNSDMFVHHGLLYSTIAGRDQSESVVPIKTILRHYPTITFHKDTITTIDTQKRSVSGKKSYRYDKLVLALGQTDYFYGINGAEKFSYSTRGIDGALEFGKAFHDALATEQKDQVRVAVIGGGPTGIELAGSLLEYGTRVCAAHHAHDSGAEIMLFEKADRILPGLSKTASKQVQKVLHRRGVVTHTGQEIGRISKAYITANDQRTPVDLVVWASGGQVHQLLRAYPDVFRLSAGGRVVVNQHLEAYPGVFVVGDAAETKYSGLASTALHDARFVAEYIDRLVKNKSTRCYRPRKPTVSIPVFRFWGYVETKGIYMKGLLGSMVRRLIELNSYAQFLSLDEAYKTWRRHRTSSDLCTLCKKAEQKP